MRIEVSYGHKCHVNRHKCTNTDYYHIYVNLPPAGARVGTNDIQRRA